MRIQRITESGLRSPYELLQLILKGLRGKGLGLKGVYIGYRVWDIGLGFKGLELKGCRV